MIIKNSPSTKRSNQAKDKEQIKYSYKESFKRDLFYQGISELSHAINFPLDAGV